jgi:hypothetical protein
MYIRSSIFIWKIVSAAAGFTTQDPAECKIMTEGGFVGARGYTKGDIRDQFRLENYEIGR